MVTLRSKFRATETLTVHRVDHQVLAQTASVGVHTRRLVLVCVRHEPPGPNSHPFEDYPLAGSAAILCAGGPDVIRKEAWSFHRTVSGVRLCCELEEPKGPEGWLLSINAFAAVLSTEGRVVGLFWAN